jgi:hypothetical protein
MTPLYVNKVHKKIDKVIKVESFSEAEQWQ